MVVLQAAEMFYFLFESRSDPTNDPVVLWMTGVIIAAMLLSPTSTDHSVLMLTKLSHARCMSMSFCSH